MRLLVLSEVLNNACGQIRLLRPLSYLQREGLLEARIFPADRNDPPTLDQVDWADRVILQRVRHLRWRPYLKRARQKGIPVVYEMDDNLFALPREHPEYKSFFNMFLKRLRYAWFVRHADAVTTSTATLAGCFRELNGNTRLLRNYVDDALVSPRSVQVGEGKNEAGGLTIGYAGTPTHRYEFPPVLEALEKLGSLYPDRVRFTFFGYAPDALATADNVSCHTTFMDYGDYLNAVYRAGIDVALAPLEANLFNACKSNIKYLEYGLGGIPGIYSDVGPYRETVRHGETGLLVRENRVDDWLEVLNQVLARPEMLKAMGANARQEVEGSYLLKDHFREWWDLYQYPTY